MSQTTELLDHTTCSPRYDEMHADALSRTPISGAQAYYRSRLFTPHTSINPLIAAAESLLSLHHKLKRLEEHPSIDKLHQILVHEINAFETSAKNRGFHTETILIARYMLCALLDETVLQTAWGQQGPWQDHKLLSTFHREQSADTRLFLILDRLYEDPQQHIDLIELIYLCLSLGFEGQYRHQPQGKNLLDQCIDKLYHCIRQCRREPKALLKPVHEVPTAAVGKRTSLKALLWKNIAVSLILMTSIYLGFAYLFNLVTAPVQQQVQQINQADAIPSVSTQSVEPS